MTEGVHPRDAPTNLATIQLPPEPLYPSQQILGRAAGGALPFEAPPQAIQLSVQLVVHPRTTMIAA
ncbi:hypothetical protein [Mycolicibacterium aubagnense]|uniref:Uncharacterized protein n=1 Tax=Mycolicibacterium aubagnense TaxID=319707 RepID=A0ABN5Z1N1_9MYCO|nr:hypothetical protein [Mycolicibacterium aubagnense]BBX87232.1 hypothetical protein MAUB_51050 [Mycolicibacterium aubagnense]